MLKLNNLTFRRMLIASFVGCFGWASALADVVSGPVAIDDLARLPAVQSLSLSQEGDVLVGLIENPSSKSKTSPSLALWDPVDLSKPPLIANPDKDVEFIFVSALKAGKILVVARKPWTGRLSGCGEGKSIGSTRTYLTKVFITDKSFSKFKEPFTGVKNLRRSQSLETCLQIASTVSIISTLPLDPAHVLISRLNSRTLKSEILKYNLIDGSSELITRGTVRGIMDMRTFEVLTKSQIDFKDGEYVFETKVRNPKTGELEKQDPLTWNSAERYSVDVVARDEETGKYFVLTDQFSDHVEAYLYDAARQKYDEGALVSNPDFSIAGLIFGSTASDFGKLIGFAVGADAVKIEYVDPGLSAVQAAFQKSFPGKNVRIADYNQDRSKILIEVEASDMPPRYFILKNKRSTTYLGSARPWLKDHAFSKTELVYYPSRDGRQIPGLLTLPVGWQEGDTPPPAIVLPHGGPWARDYADWDISGWVPFLTTRGYAVLQPQYRGSTGWGRDHWKAGDAQWGLKMQDDKDDGANWMVEQGYADKDKIAIFGYSYGGFAAFAATVRKGGPFRCAIAGAGVSDLTRLGNNWSSNRLQRALQGKTVKGMDPNLHTDDANIPILIFHGDRDVRVPIFHARNFYNAVKNKVPAKLVVIKDQPHSLPWTPAMQQTSLQAIEDFLTGTCGM